jgi:hypothetical protein
MVTGPVLAAGGALGAQADSAIARTTRILIAKNTFFINFLLIGFLLIG